MAESKFLIDDQSLDKHYQVQMESWRKATGKKHWTQLIPVTSYFFADERNQKELQSSTVTKTIQTRPAREDGIYNLLTLIGTFYALGGIQSKELVEAFFIEHLIDLPPHTTWQIIWQHIEDGTIEYRKAIEQPQILNMGNLTSIERSYSIPPFAQPEPIPDPHLVTVAPAHSKPKPLIRLRLVQAIAGIAPFLAAIIASILGRPQTALVSDIGVITLIGPNNQLLTLRAGSQTISAHDELTWPAPISIGKMVTVSFKIQNTDTHPIRITTLSGGAQGPSGNAVDWQSPQSPFPPVTNIFLQPGETYEYTQSRAFFAPGNYFVEPTMQDALGNWGGIQPFPRINFKVK